MSVIERFETVLDEFPDEPDEFAEDVMTRYGDEKFAKLDPELRALAIGVVGKVFAMSDDDVTGASKNIDAFAKDDPFLRTDSKVPLLDIADNARREGKNSRFALRSALALRVSRRRTAQYMGFDPTTPGGYAEIVGRNDFNKMCEFVTESVKRLR